MNTNTRWRRNNQELLPASYDDAWLWEVAVCELCNLKVKTKYYGADNSWIVVSCLSCKVPMFVLKEHKSTISIFELEDALMLFHALGLKGELDFGMRKIKNHFHFHVR